MSAELPGLPEPGPFAMLTDAMVPVGRVAETRNHLVTAVGVPVPGFQALAGATALSFELIEDVTRGDDPAKMLAMLGLIVRRDLVRTLAHAVVTEHAKGSHAEPVWCCPACRPDGIEPFQIIFAVDPGPLNRPRHV